MRWKISALLVLSASAQAAYVVNNAGRQINGTAISADADGSVTLRTASGQVLTFRDGQYRSAVADPPKELGLAEQLIQEGHGERAVPYLEQVKAQYRYLKWDQHAIQLLADHYYASGQFRLACAAFQALDDQTVPQNQQRLREAMVKSGEQGAVLRVLNDDIRAGSREAAAQAYVMRGRLKAENDDIAGARRDWFKVVLFFKTQNEAVEQARHLLKEYDL